MDNVTLPVAVPRKRGWTADRIVKEEVSVDLGPAQLAAIAELVAKIKRRGLKLEEVTKTDFSHPDLDGFLAQAFHGLRIGHGILVVRGFPIDSYDEDDIQLIYWGIGCHLGRGVSQSSRGDYIGHVTDRGSGRGYQGTRKLSLHTDAPEFIGLLCIRRAKTGGENVFASALKVREIIQEEHPEYLPVLEKGFPWHRRGEEAPGAEPITPYDVPIYSEVDGVVSCRYAQETILAALHDQGRSLTPFEKEALDFFESVPLRDGIRCDMQLEAGEAVFTNNFEVMHARNEFEDWPEPSRKRLLYRLWMQGEPTRPLKREVLVFQNRNGRHGIDPQEGREPGKIGYDVLKSAVNH